jgi:hypothetical protein
VPPPGWRAGWFTGTAHRARGQQRWLIASRVGHFLRQHSFGQHRFWKLRFWQHVFWIHLTGRHTRRRRDRRDMARGPRCRRMEHHVLDGLLHCRTHGGCDRRIRIVRDEIAGFLLLDDEQDAAAEDGSRLQPEPGVRWRRGADDEPDSDDRAGEGAHHRNHRAAGRDLCLWAAVDGDERGRLAVHEDRDLPAECHTGTGPRGTPPALHGSARSGQHEGGAVTVRVGDRGQRGQQRVGPRVHAVGQRG